MQTHIDLYLEAIRNDYRKWADGSAIRNQMIEEFCKALTVSEGKKYVKVIIGPQRSVHSFIVKEDGAKFKRGSILKAASWAAPAMNFARGNVIESNYPNVRWTGA